MSSRNWGQIPDPTTHEPNHGTSVMAHWAGNEAPGKGRYLGRFLPPTGTSLPGHADTPAHPPDRDNTGKPGPGNPRENRPGVTYSERPQNSRKSPKTWPLTR